MESRVWLVECLGAEGLVSLSGFCPGMGQAWKAGGFLKRQEAYPPPSSSQVLNLTDLGTWMQGSCKTLVLVHRLCLPHKGSGPVPEPDYSRAFVAYLWRLGVRCPFLFPRVYPAQGSVLWESITTITLAGFCCCLFACFTTFLEEVLSAFRRYRCICWGFR